MALDFPSSPTVGQQYPVTPVAGQPVYIWDGVKWTAAQVSGAVRYDTAQTLTTPQLVQARQNIYAAPYDAMAYSGMQINGGMEVSQENGTTPRSSVGNICDGWLVDFSGTMAISAAQAAGSITTGYRNHLVVAIATAQSSLSAGHYLQVFQPIEGYRITRLAWGTASAQPITIGFWSQHFRAGLYSISVSNNPASRSYVATYTQAVSNIAQYNTVTIPGDITGTWKVDNTAGINLTFCIAAGSTWTTASNTWTAGNFFSATGQVNGAGTTSDVFRITGVTILPGTQAPTAAQSMNIMRSYDQELVTCQRYYYKGNGDHAGVAHSALIAGGPFSYKTTMRAVPTIAATFGVNTGSSGTFALSAPGASVNNFGYYNSANNWSVTAEVYFATLTIDARL